MCISTTCRSDSQIDCTADTYHYDNAADIRSLLSSDCTGWHAGSWDLFASGLDTLLEPSEVLALLGVHLYDLPDMLRALRPPADSGNAAGTFGNCTGITLREHLAKGIARI